MKRHGWSPLAFALTIAAAVVCGGVYVLLRSDHPFAETARSILASKLYGYLSVPRTFPGKSLEERLQGTGFAIGNPVLIRVFKEESKLEIWLERQGRFQ